MSAFDAATLGILWDRLIAATDEAYAALLRSSFSPIVREALDAVTQLFDARGRAVAQASLGPPSFIGTLPVTLQHLLEKFPRDELAPGDVLATNDPWLGTGHLNDLSLIRPIMRRGELVGFAGVVAHLPDIGGVLWSATAREVYEEGLRLPPCRLVRRGRFDPDLVRIIRANVRLPDQTLADIQSQVAAMIVAERLLLQLLAEYCIRDFETLASAIIDQSGRVMHQDLQRLPRGEYRGETWVEGPTDQHRIACTVRIQEGGVTVDFRGTDGQSRSGVNCPVTYTRAYSVYAVKCVVSPQLPNNEGSTAPVHVTAPEGCILNPRPPAATGARHLTGWHAPIAIWNALSHAVPERVIAEPGLPSSCTVSGVDHTERPFVAITVIGGGGTGARPDSDGLDSTGIPTVTSHVSVEVLESTSPLLVEELTLVPDSGGAGRFRGGLGARYRVRSLASQPLQVAIIGNKFRFPAQGLHGGRPGRPRRAYLNGKVVNPLGRYQLPPGGTLIMVNGGGGGFFPPRGRELTKVIEDVRNGFVTRRAASRDYGVIVDPQTWTGRRRA